ncbi:MAG: hypothetical protein K0U98_27385 [Deltaproteobacteria bacterium]|nr:hypothetical protein [Deltaproteobacteria bacterium]
MHTERSFYRSRVAVAMALSFLFLQPTLLFAGTTGNCSVGDAPLPFVGFPCDQGFSNLTCEQIGSAWVCDLAANGVGSSGGDNFLTDAKVVTHFSHGGPTFSAWGLGGMDSFCCTFEIGTAEAIDRVALIGTDQNDLLHFQDPGSWLYNPPANLASVMIGEMRGLAGVDVGLGSLELSGSYRDELHGDDGNDILSGSFGVDRLYGGAGNDQLNGDGARDFLYGEDGADTLEGGAGNDQVFGGPGNDMLYGGLGEDDLKGDDGDDLILGGAGADELSGGAGADTLCDGVGGDLYLGGPDGDKIWNAYPGDAPASGSGGGTSSYFFPDECGHISWLGSWVPRTCKNVLTTPPPGC